MHRSSSIPPTSNGKKIVSFQICFKVRKLSIRIIWLYGWINLRQYTHTRSIFTFVIHYLLLPFIVECVFFFTQSSNGIQNRIAFIEIEMADWSGGAAAIKPFNSIDFISIVPKQLLNRLTMATKHCNDILTHNRENCSIYRVILFIAISSVSLPII